MRVEGLACLAIVAMSVCAADCAGSIVGPALAPSTPHSEALVIIPGFGYSRSGERTLRSMTAAMTDDGVDVYVPTYISRGGMNESRMHLRQFFSAHRLNRYARLHVFAFIAGAWTFNPLADAEALPNLATVVYDRSPMQERAARVATEKLHLLTWIRYGSPVFDLAATPYPPLTVPRVRVAIMVETKPTAFVSKHQATVRTFGPLRFECEAMAQRYDDCLYLALSHDQVYTRFVEVWPEVRAFIHTGRFTSAAVRTAPGGDPLTASEAR